jgi:hypothetical protein
VLPQVGLGGEGQAGQVLQGDLGAGVDAAVGEPVPVERAGRRQPPDERAEPLLLELRPLVGVIFAGW